MRKCLFEAPFDVTKSSRQNLLEWVGEDDRLMRLVKHCDMYEIPMRFLPGKTWCYVDVLGSGGYPITFSGAHSMSINLDADSFLLFGSEDIDAGIARIDEIYKNYGNKATKDEVQSLYTL